MNWLIICLLIFATVSSARANILVSPSDDIYLLANRQYDSADYEKAAELYAQYLNLKPNADLAIPAKLNLGMSFYYLKDWAKARETLSALPIDDPAIKKYVAAVLVRCRTELGETAATPIAPDLAGLQTMEPVVIFILDVYLDITRSLVIHGKTSTKATLTIDNSSAGTDENNEFTATISWRKGRPVVIKARGQNNSEGVLNYYPDSEPPLKPLNLRVRNSSANSAFIEWDDNRETDIKGYKLYYNLTGGSRRQVNEIILKPNYEIIGLGKLTRSSNRNFQVTVTAIDKMDNESDTSSVLEFNLP